MSIRSRLWVAAAVSVALVVALWLALYGMASSMRDRQALVTGELTKAQMLEDATALLQQLDQPGNDVLESWDHRGESQKFSTYQQTFESHQRDVERLIADDAELSAGFLSSKPDVVTMAAHAQAVFEQAEVKEQAEAAGDLPAAQAAMTRASERMAQMDQSYTAASRKLRELDGIQRRRIAKLLAEMDAFNRDAVMFAFGLLLVALVVAVGTSVLLARSITAPIGRAVGLAERIANGDLRDPGVAATDDEVGKLLLAMSHMAGNLRALMANVRGGVQTLSGSTSAVGATASELATTAAQQASSIAEIGTTVEEIKQTSQAAASAARDVADGSERAALQGREGRERLEGAVATMQAINERVTGIAGQILKLAEQTSQIGDIVESVNDLAEQSNLLAVNASIEAAKAGEHGRGFAVVASEVRSLAEQSKRATQQIRAILLDIQKATQSAVMATEEGTKRADDGRRAIEALRDVVDNLAGTLEDTSGKGRQIAGAASQQAAGIAQISSAIEGVSRAGQDNAKGVRQLDQAVRDLGRLAAELKAQSDRFQV